MQMCDMVTKCDVTQHGIKGWTTDEVFKELCFLREKAASVGDETLTFLIFKVSQEQLLNTEGKEKPKDHNRPL